MTKLTERRIVILDDHITPYRIPIFRALSHALPNLKVLFCVRNLHQTEWQPGENLGFEYEVLPGTALRLRRPPYREPRVILLNPTLLFRLLQLRPAIVVGYAFSAPAWAAFLYSRLTGAAYVCWSTDTLHSERFLDPFQRLSRRLIIGGSDAFITASQSGVEKFVSYGAPADKVKVVTQRTLVEPEPVDNDPPVAIMNHRLLYVGALSERKGVDHLLRATASIKQDLQKTEVLLVGSGPEYHNLLDLADRLGIGERVRFEGFVQPEELSGYYREADVFVFPTLEDTFGVALADAVAAGLPVVASKYAGAAGDYVDHGVNGWVLEPRDHQAFGQTISRLLEDGETRRRMGQESLRIAHSKPFGQAVAAFMEALEIAQSGRGDRT